jgi:hypothetical protein
VAPPNQNETGTEYFFLINSAFFRLAQITIIELSRGLQKGEKSTKAISV